MEIQTTKVSDITHAIFFSESQVFLFKKPTYFIESESKGQWLKIMSHFNGMAVI